ncbi:hypothetical protein L873DRAFT_1793778 [Choiromyces venosus 120613-1]|uniref:Uncharacterized protein n=1 Tax=Choiromyces venosus 120613-1 TaxID=1336337 RepID=A0A3N4J9B9_9PEZI|nr:hypothetical protein L873DRAFT_1793778 [Choiromyces venosus 120613-1]
MNDETADLRIAEQWNYGNDGTLKETKQCLVTPKSALIACTHLGKTGWSTCITGNKLQQGYPPIHTSLDISIPIRPRPDRLATPAADGYITPFHRCTVPKRIPETSIQTNESIRANAKNMPERPQACPAALL